MRYPILWAFIILLLSAPLFSSADVSPPFYYRGAVYLDWFGSRYEDNVFANQVSARVRFDLIDKPGTGWTLAIDARDRIGFTGTTRNNVLLYNANLTYDRPGSRFMFSLGQMSLYDSAGIGQLLGGLAGFKPARSILIGAYGGLESGIYLNRLDTDLQKLGAFARWTGSRGKSLSVSYNHLSFSGTTERAYLYANLFLPATRGFVFYGDMEYELGPHVEGKNRLSRVFLNARVDLGRWADITGNYSSGKGLDFHRFLLEASQDPSLQDRSIERFFYSRYYGARLSLKPFANTRFFISRQESERKDLDVVNHSWRFGASGWNLFGTGLAFAGDYTAHRGDLAESDSIYASITKDFGRFSVTGSFSNTFNGVRIDASSGLPEIVHLDDYENIGAGVLLRINRSFSASLEYNLFLRESIDEHFFFVRLIYRMN